MDEPKEDRVADASSAEPRLDSPAEPPAEPPTGDGHELHTGSGPDPDAPPTTATSPRRRFNVPLAYLRTFIIVLVVAHHAAMPYNVIVPESPAASMTEHLSSMHSIAPVNDAQRSDTLSLFGAFNDEFMMSMMFLLSGLFVWGSLLRKGSATYLRDRLIRLGIPLVLMVLLRPLTYYPTYLQAGGSAGLSGFWGEWSSISWRGGPIWFLEVLLLFDILIALTPGLWQRLNGPSRLASSRLPQQPFRTFVLLVAMSALAYVPLTAAVGSFYWLQIGPAQVQVNRLLFYAVYFLAGVLLGAYGIEKTFLEPGSSLARRWGVWTAAALGIFTVSLIAAVSSESEILVGSLFSLSSAAISFAFLALFLRFVRTQRRIYDSLFHSSYGIYIVHYGVISYVAYALLASQAPAAAKWLVVFTATMAICWGAVAVLRRIPSVRRVI